ncbi:MAG: hypothetical protein DHS20C16_10230 [Phycisphaerae bacterium]|nr:MAG: hypothetical protein DHS20C16_10230 [Phycisphaerae bacterium]
MRAKRLLAVIIGLVLAQVAEASQVVPMSLDQLADYSGAVIVGTVANVQSHWRENPRRIESEVTFDAVTFLKGDRGAGNESFTLTVPGGKVGEMQMRVCCAPEFQSGDKWVLMLLPTYKTYPVAGIYRGALRVIRDGDGVERVHNAVGRMVTGIDARGHLVVAGQSQKNAAQHLAAEHGVHLKSPAKREVASKKAMRLDDLVNALTPVLASSRKHALDQPAGVRVAADLRSVSLKSSSMGRAAGRGENSASRELPKAKSAEVDPRKANKKEAAR